MSENKIYDFPGGVCPSCEHSPLNVSVSVNDYGTAFVSYCCPACGDSGMLPQTKNTGNDSRNRKLQQEWARRVKERDGYACVICGETDGIDAHHLISASKAPKWQGRIGNGVTLCRQCHKWVHDTTTKWPEKYK